MSASPSTSPVELPLGTHPAPLEFTHFPTRAQTFLWRNWEMVPLERLALVLGCDESQLLEMARDLGLRVPPHVNTHWLEQGYVTLIRQNWHLLPYEQLLQLLGWDAKRLDAVLREDDFLWVKLGFLKPNCAPLAIEPLSSAQHAQTAQIRALMERHFPTLDEPDTARAFDFLEQLKTPAPTARLEWKEARENEICLDESWNLDWTENGAVQTFARTFIETHQARWGVRLKRGEKDAAPRLVLEIVPDEDAARESHAIEITPAEIRVSACDEVGLLRGLQWLEAAMLARGGPFLTPGKTTRQTRFDLRLLYPYCGVFGDALLDAKLDPFPDGLLSRLSQLGVNGVWLHCLLTELAPWDKAPNLGAGHQQRLENLRALTERAARYGIGVYLYMNEPRGLPPHAFDESPGLAPLRGVPIERVGVAALCTSHPATLDYLREGTAFLFESVPQLAGVFSITMSENPTHCFSHGAQQQCPRCRSRSAAEVVAEVNAALEAGVHRSRPDARVIAWNWGWNKDWSRQAVALLPAGVDFMATSEEALPTNVGGVAGAVLDYSISQVGPGPKARGDWESAHENGVRALAKVQVNNTWELSCTSYLPVPDLVREHLGNLEEAGVSGLMLSWTLGGAPSANLEVCARSYWHEATETAATSPDQPQTETNEQVQQALSCFSQAFREFPFHIGVAYTAPQNAGPTNLLYAAPTGFKATMVGLPYDDLESWRAIYPPDVFEQQWHLLSEGWQRGLALLNEARVSLEPDENSALESLDELERIARAAYLHFASTGAQVAFVRRRDELNAATDANQQSELRAEIRDILRQEIDFARQLHDLAREDARIGFEASNHYSYTLQSLREKVLNCENLLGQFED